MTFLKLRFKIVQMWIDREIAGELQALVKKRPCVLLTGARQTGKSALLERTFPDYNYISLDLPHAAAEARENGGYFLEKHPAPVIIDEIQYAPELFRFLKIEIDKKRNRFGRYILSGSQKFSLMKGIRESLSGRISILECHSLSARELRRRGNAKKPLSTRQLLTWMLQGGYPEIYAQRLKPERFYADYLATYLERDVRQLVNVKDLATFNKFLRLLALRSGQILSMNALSADAGVSAHTVKSWLSVLEASNVIYLLKPFYNNYGKRLVKSPKLYFLDTGLLCFLAGVHSREALEASSLLGGFFETFCLGQLIRDFCNRGLPLNLYYFRDRSGNEADFIAPEGDRLNLYECKWKFQSGGLPKNLVKVKSIVGEDKVKSCKILTASDASEKIGENSFVSNLIDL